MSRFVYSFRQSFISLSAPLRLILLVAIILIFALFGTLLAMIIAIPAFDVTMPELAEVMADPDSQNIGVIKFFQIFQSVTLFILPALIFAWLFSDKPASFLFADRNISLSTFMLVLISILAGIPFLNYITDLNSKLDLPDWMDNIEQKMIQMEESAAELTELFLETGTTADLLLNFVMIAILPALGEEFLFRGVIQSIFVKWFRNSHIAVIVTAFLFSFIHFQFFGFLPRFALGLYFGYLLIWSGSIWLPVAAHLVNNGLAVIYYHFTPGTPGKSTIDNIGLSEDSRYVLYLSVFITAIVIGIIYMREKRVSVVERDLS